MIELVISGGQTGVDQAGWRAAKRCGIPTGGLMPRGFITEGGSRYDFAEIYGARELEEAYSRSRLGFQYAERTSRNVKCSSLTILLGDPTSLGSRATYKAFRRFYEPGTKDPGISYVREGWIHVLYPATCWPTSDDVASYITKMPHAIVNIAGNRESVSPGIGDWAEEYLVKVFENIIRLGSACDRTSEEPMGVCSDPNCEACKELARPSQVGDSVGRASAFTYHHHAIPTQTIQNLSTGAASGASAIVGVPGVTENKAPVRIRGGNRKDRRREASLARRRRSP